MVSDLRQLVRILVCDERVHVPLRVRIQRLELKHIARWQDKLGELDDDAVFFAASFQVVHLLHACDVLKDRVSNLAKPGARVRPEADVGFWGTFRSADDAIVDDALR